MLNPCRMKKDIFPLKRTYSAFFPCFSSKAIFFQLILAVERLQVPARPRRRWLSVSPVPKACLLCQPRPRVSAALKRRSLPSAPASGGSVPARRASSERGALRPLPGRGQRPPQPQGPPRTRARGSSSAGIARNAQVGTGEGAGAVTANVPVGMNDQFNSAIRAGGGECKLSNVLHSCSYSNSSPDLANRHFHL